MTSDAPRFLHPLRRASGAPRVRVVAPSSPFSDDKLRSGLARLADAGFIIDEPAGLRCPGHPYLNGSDEERLASLQSALESDADVVWLARGGYGLTRLLSRLVLPPGPLPVVAGFSDATALMAWLLSRGVRSLHAPLATTVGDEPEASFAHLLRLLRAQRSPGGLEGLEWVSPTVPQNAVHGYLFAGNLCVLTHLVGTPAFPPLHGAVLVLEEVGERPYRIDRMLTQLIDARALDGVRAVIVGHLTGCDEPGTATGRPSPLPVLIERLATLDIPVLAGAQVGHETPNFAIPNGATVHLEAGTRGRIHVETASLFPDLGSP